MATSISLPRFSVPHQPEGSALSVLGPGHGSLLPAPSSRRRRTLFKVTGYRLLNVFVMISLGTVKAIFSYLGGTAVPTTLDWVIGIVCAALLYCLGWLEDADPLVARWFFEYDYSPYLGSLVLRAIGIVICLTFVYFGFRVAWCIVQYPITTATPPITDTTASVISTRKWDPAATAVALISWLFASMFFLSVFVPLFIAAYLQ